MSISEINPGQRPQTPFEQAVNQDPVIQGAIERDEMSPKEATFKHGVLNAQILVEHGVKELEANVIKGETENVTEVVQALLTRGTGNAVAGYGTAKTTLFPNIHRLIDGLNRFSTVANREDVTASEITGRSQKHRTVEQVLNETGDPTGDSNETVTQAELEAMVLPDTQYLFVDEATRKRQKALAALLDITAKSRIHTKDGWQTMGDYEGGIFASNPNERGLTTERLLPALADRMIWGVIMAKEEDWDKILEGVVDDEFEPTPELIAPVLTLPELHVAQLALRQVKLDTGTKILIKDMSKVAAKKFQSPIETDYGDMQPHIMGPGRFAQHLMLNTRLKAISRGHITAELQDVQDALSTKVHGLMTGNGVSFEDPIYEAIGEIFGTSKANTKVAIAQLRPEQTTASANAAVTA